MVEPVQLLHEEVPIPRTLQAEITELITELLYDPLSMNSLMNARDV